MLLIYLHWLSKDGESRVPEFIDLCGCTKRNTSLSLLFLDPPDPQSPSFSWRGILASKELIKNGMCWQIGTATTVSTWTDP